MTEEEKKRLNEETAKAEQEQQELTMCIKMTKKGGMAITFPGLNDKVITYGFLKMAEKTLDLHYARIENMPPVKGGIRNFVRGMKH
jgi:hypothetical protein